MVNFELCDEIEKGDFFVMKRALNKKKVREKSLIIALGWEDARKLEILSSIYYYLITSLIFVFFWWWHTVSGTMLWSPA